MRWLVASISSSLLLVVAAAATTGCAQGTYYDGHGVYPHIAYRLPAYLRGLSPEDEEDATCDVYAPPYAPPTRRPAAPLRPDPTPPAPVHRAFDSAAAVGAIHGVDLAPCQARGAPRTYGHARITFSPAGAPVEVVIDSPPGLSSDAVTCLGERFALATAPPFDGAPMTVGTSYFVR